MTNFRLCGITHPGLARRINEDCFCLINRGRCRNALGAVADGIGGHNSGDTASEMTCRTLLGAGKSIMDSDSEDEIGHSIYRLLAETNSRMGMTNMLRRSRLPMGCTVVLGVFTGKSVVMAHAGDSRFYEYTESGELIRHSTDHTLWETMIRKNNLASDTPVPAQLANVIINAVGTYPELRLDVRTIDFHTGSSYLMCSDGLHHEISDGDISVIMDKRLTRRATLAALLQKTMSAGASDNISIVLGNCNPE